MNVDPLHISDQDFSDAASLIASQTNYTISQCQNVLQSYVQLALSKSINTDYPAATIDQQNAIANAVDYATPDFQITDANVHDILNSMTLLASTGQVNPQISQPVTWIGHYTSALATSVSTSTPDTVAGTTVGKSIQDVFSGIGSTVGTTVNSLASSLGLNISTFIIIIIIGILLIVYLRYGRGATA